MKTYYIVEERDNDNDPIWLAYPKKIFVKYSSWDYVSGTRTHINAKDCERKLRLAVAGENFKPIIVKTVQI
jgi:hypothetical protein